MYRSSAEYWTCKFICGKDDRDDDDCDHKDRGCDRESARALKKIVSLLDELNDSDLRLLDDIVERALCERGHK